MTRGTDESVSRRTQIDIKAVNSDFSGFFALETRSGKTDRLLTNGTRTPIHLGNFARKGQIVQVTRSMVIFGFTGKTPINRGPSWGMPENSL